MATLSTHVLDTSQGRPVPTLLVTLETVEGATLDQGYTDGEGRIAAIGDDLPSGDYLLRFETAAYFDGCDVKAFYPQVVVTFAVDGDEHFHVPLLLSPYGYSTYRGS